MESAHHCRLSGGRWARLLDKDEKDPAGDLLRRVGCHLVLR